MATDDPQPTTPSDLPEALRFETVPYQAEGGCPPLGLLVLIVCSLMGNLIAAWGASFVYDWGGCGCSIVGWAIFFLFFGAIAIGSGILGVHFGKVRNPSVAGFVGFVAGLLSTGALAWFRMQNYLNQLADEDPNHHAQLIAAGFWLGDYIQTWGFWDYASAVAYLVVIAGGGYVMLAGAAANPFCAACHVWKENRMLGEFSMDADLAGQVISRGEVVRLADLAESPRPRSRLRIQASVCPRCGQACGVDVKLVRVSINAKEEEETTDLAHVTYPGPALAVFESVFGAPATKPDRGGGATA